MSHPPPDQPPPAFATPGEGEDRFRRTFEQAPIGIGHVTPDGRWIEFNQRFLDFLGYSREELQRLRFTDFTHPEDLPEDTAKRKRLLAGEIDFHRMEKRYIRKDGTIVWGDLTMCLVRNPDGAPIYFIGAVEDITQRKGAEEALRASEARYERIAANVPGMVYQFVLRRDGSISLPFASEGTRDLIGVAPEEVQRNPAAIIDLLHPEDRPRWEAALTDSATTLAPWRWEGRVVLPSGAQKWVQGAARPERLADGSILWDGLLVDVTERRQAAARLAESEQRYRSLFDRHPDAVFWMDLEGRLLSVNPAAEAVSGFRPDELLGRSFLPLILPEHRALAASRFQAAVSGVAQAYEVAIQHQSGRPVDMGVTIVPIVVDGAVVGVFGIAKDLTVQRSLEIQLAQAQKMEAVGRLAGGIAHDFNNLLTTILANTQMLLADADEGPVREDVQAIRQAADRAAVLTRQLLAFSRKQAVKHQLVDLNRVVLDTMRLLERTLPEGIALDAALGKVGAVLADPGQLEQALVNLALNARDAMPHGGALTLRTGDVLVDETLARRHPGLRRGVYVTLAVEDTGVGMPPELQAHVFEPFFTTKPVGQGTGLGLATVYGLVEHWGGHVTVESVPGAGTTFTIYLPRHAGAPQPDAPSAPANLPGGTETVLVVEDEAAVRSSIRRILGRHGYTVLEARHGADALRVAEEAPAPIDLVLTDLAMPEMNGRELIAVLQHRDPAPRILAMSGYDEHAALRGEPLPAGAAFLEKPFTLEGLLHAVRAALDTEPPAAR